MLNKILVFTIVLICTIGLGAASVSISGTVTESGSGLSDVDINIGGSSTTTNASGYYHISSLAENTTHIVYASKNLYTTSSLSVPVTVNDITNADISISKTSLAGFMNKISECVTCITAMFTSIMSLFMEPPLIIFVGIVFFTIVIGAIAKYMKGMH